MTALAEATSADAADITVYEEAETTRRRLDSGVKIYVFYTILADSEALATTYSTELTGLTSDEFDAHLLAAASVHGLAHAFGNVTTSLSSPFLAPPRSSPPPDDVISSSKSSSSSSGGGSILLVALGAAAGIVVGGSMCVFCAIKSKSASVAPR